MLHSTLFLLCLIFITDGFGTVRIFTFHYNLPHLLEMQCKALEKFVVDDYELIVFNDARDPSIKLKIEQVCGKYGATCIRFKPEWHNYNSPYNSHIKNIIEKNPSVVGDRNSPSHYHSRIIQYALETFAYSHDDIVVVLDGDAFPIRTISMRQMLQNFDIIGSTRAGHGCEYFTPVFVAFDPRKIKTPSEFQLHWDIIHNREQDTGAYSYYFMKEHPEVKIEKVPFLRGDWLSLWSQEDLNARNLDSREMRLINLLKGFYYEIHMDWHIFHFKGSSHRGISVERNQRVNTFLNEILSEKCPPLREIKLDVNSEAPWPGDD